MMAGSFAELMAEGQQARREHRSADALRAYARAVAIARVERDESAEAEALCRQAGIRRDLVENDAALADYREAAAIFDRLRNRDRLRSALRYAHTIRHVADVLQDLRRFDEALPLYRETVRIYRGDADAAVLDVANALRGLALLRGEMGDVTESKALWTETRKLYAEVGVQAGVDECGRRLARLDELTTPA